MDEFGINPLRDVRFKRGKKHTLVSGHGAMKTGTSYLGFNKFSGKEGEATKGNLISYIEPDSIAYSQG